MSKNNGIVHSAITRQILEKKIKRRMSAAALGDASGNIKDLTNKVNAVQSSLSSIYAAMSGLARQIGAFDSITQTIQTTLTELEEEVNSLIDSTLQKISYLLEDGQEGIISHTVDDNQDTFEVLNPFNSKDIFVQVVDESSSDEIVGVSVEIEEEKITLYMAHCDVKGQYRVILMG